MRWQQAGEATRLGTLQVLRLGYAGAVGWATPAPWAGLRRRRGLANEAGGSQGGSNGEEARWFGQAPWMRGEV